MGDALIYSENVVVRGDPRLAMRQSQLPPTADMALAAASAALRQTGREQMQHRSAMKHRLLDDLVGESK